MQNFIFLITSLASPYIGRHYSRQGTVLSGEFSSPLGPQLNSSSHKKENIGSGQFIIWTGRLAGPIEPPLFTNNKEESLSDANIGCQAQSLKSGWKDGETLSQSERSMTNLLTNEKPPILVSDKTVELEMPSHLKSGGWVLVYVEHYSRLYCVLWLWLTSIIFVNTIAIKGVHYII